MLQSALDLQDQIIAWRRDFHQHPELSFQEFRTAETVADALREMGLRVKTGVAKTGVVGYLGEGRPAVGIRADMDALPLQETNDVPYASQTPGVMHACGHDAHTAILLGVARMLSAMEDPDFSPFFTDLELLIPTHVRRRPHEESMPLFQKTIESARDSLGFTFRVSYSG